MNFEDCKKIMIQYLEAREALHNLMLNHCANCTERIHHCDECPMLIDGACKFGE